MEVSKNTSDGVVDFLSYNKLYVLIKKLHMLLGNQNKSFICTGCLNSYTSETLLLIHKPKYENYDITTIITSSESHFHWNNHFHKNPLNFRKNADFEADKEFDNSNIRNKTTSIYEQNLVVIT